MIDADSRGIKAGFLAYIFQLYQLAVAAFFDLLVHQLAVKLVDVLMKKNAKVAGDGPWLDVKPVPPPEFRKRD